MGEYGDVVDDVEIIGINRQLCFCCTLKNATIREVLRNPTNAGLVNITGPKLSFGTLFFKMPKDSPGTAAKIQHCLLLEIKFIREAS